MNGEWWKIWDQADGVSNLKGWSDEAQKVKAFDLVIGSTEILAIYSVICIKFMSSSSLYSMTK